jgi:hypothetical protein
MAANTGARVRAVITYYRIKYPDTEDRLEALRSDYLTAFEAAESEGGKVSTGFGADGQTVSWMVGLTADERLDALSQVLEYFEGGMKQQGVAQARIH